MAREIELRMLVLACTCRFRLLVMSPRLSSEMASAARLVWAESSVVSRPALRFVGRSHSPRAPGRFHWLVNSARLLTAGRASDATRSRFDVRLMLLERT